MKNTSTLAVMMAATLSVSASAQMLPAPPAISLTDLLHTEQELLKTLPLGGELYWHPERLAASALPREARCSASPTMTEFPINRAGSYAECVAGFPSVVIEDDVPDVSAAQQPRARSSRSRLYSCTKGNFTGEVEISWGSQVDALGRRIFVMQTHRYRITKQNGQQGGNKANLNIGTRTNQHSGHWTMGRSPDNLVQNGQWYDLVVTSRDSRPAPAYFSDIEFVFDKSGTDPKCKTGDNYLYP